MTTININGRLIDKNHEPFIIAEAGINHNGDMDLAKKMILAAKEAGADAVKFQTFYAEDFIQDRSTLYTYTSKGKTITEPIIDMFKRCEFTSDEWKEIANFCKEQEILFLSTPGNVSDLEMLLSAGLQAVKIGSDDFVNIPLIRKYSEAGLPLLLSTGMATEEEMEDAVEASGARQGKQVCLFICTSEYPTPPDDVNISKLITLQEKFPEVVPGFSDHTQGSAAAIMAVALGARIFEKHFTLDHDLPGPDHWFSEEPDGLKEWADAIRKAYRMLGRRELQPTATEAKERAEFHRSITASCEIKKGEIFSENNLYMRRPGNGLSGKHWDQFIGKVAGRDIHFGEQPGLEDIVND